MILPCSRHCSPFPLSGCYNLSLSFRYFQSGVSGILIVCVSYSLIYCYNIENIIKLSCHSHNDCTLNYRVCCRADSILMWMCIVQDLMRIPLSHWQDFILVFLLTSLPYLPTSLRFVDQLCTIMYDYVRIYTLYVLHACMWLYCILETCAKIVSEQLPLL